MTILLAEDNKADVYVVRESLQEYGLASDLHVVADGEEAIRVIDAADADSRALHPALLLLDLNLPKKSGEEILARLRASVSCRDIPVIVMTSSDSPRDRAEAARLGATAYFRKPSQLDDYLRLGALVRKILDETAALKSKASPQFG